MKIACVLITHLMVKAELKRRPDLKDLPIIIVDRSRTRPLVIDSSPQVPAVVSGRTLEQALALRPDAVVLEADEPRYRRLFHQVLATLMGVSDRVEGADLGVAYVGIDGLERMYGGEARLVTTLLNALPGWLRSPHRRWRGQVPGPGGRLRQPVPGRDPGAARPGGPSCRPTRWTCCPCRQAPVKPCTALACTPWGKSPA